MTTATATVNTPSIPAGNPRTPRFGTYRFQAVAAMASAAGLATSQMYADRPTWGKRHVAEMMAILRKEYGYQIVKGDGADPVYRLVSVAAPAAPVAPETGVAPTPEPVAEPKADGNGPNPELAELDAAVAAAPNAKTRRKAAKARDAWIAAHPEG